MSREAFEKWHLKTFGYEPTSEQTHNANKYFQDPVWMAWLESESEQSKRIAELEETLEWWRNMFPAITPAQVNEYKSVYELAEKLQAQNAELVEALNKAMANSVMSVTDHVLCEKALASCLTKQKNV